MAFQKCPPNENPTGNPCFPNNFHEPMAHLHHPMIVPVKFHKDLCHSFQEKLAEEMDKTLYVAPIQNIANKNKYCINTVITN